MKHISLCTKFDLFFFSSCSSADEKFRWNNQGKVYRIANNKSVHLHFCLIILIRHTRVLYTLSSRKLCVVNHSKPNECHVLDEEVVIRLFGAEC